MLDATFKMLERSLLLAKWILTTVLLGTLLLARLPKTLRQIRMVLSDELECPQGHRLPAYGRMQCRRCGAIRSGWLLGACPACMSRPAYVSCGVCSDAVWNPLS